ncbi:YggT family protein, partial [Bacillus spizizenii]|nr:YggT family protein [Bacillus spizizenii]
MILYQVFTVLRLLIKIYSLALIIYIFMSVVPSTRETAFGRFLASI